MDNQPISLSPTSAAPSQYLIRFNGHISWEGQSNGLPSVIFAFLIFEGDDTNFINQLIETQTAAFLRSNAMYVQRDQGKIVDLRQTPQDRMVVPLHWITNITVDIKRLIGELSEADEAGVERLKDGKKPLKN